MKAAVIRFPGSNCDQDAFYALRDELKITTEYVWHQDHSLDGFDIVFVPGGFSYGDYLRCGAIAARSNIMSEVARLAERGNPVIGICNGFQVLCEAGLLAGALLQNVHEKFLCQDVFLQRVNQSSLWTRGVDRMLRIPIAHGEGRYTCDDDTLKRLQDGDQIAFRYVVGPEGSAWPDANPNGSRDAIAGVLNERGNVLGMMPHPERAVKSVLGGTDGLQILSALQSVAV